MDKTPNLETLGKLMVFTETCSGRVGDPKAFSLAEV